VAGSFCFFKLSRFPQPDPSSITLSRLGIKLLCDDTTRSSIAGKEVFWQPVLQTGWKEKLLSGIIITVDSHTNNLTRPEKRSQNQAETCETNTA